MSQNLQNFVKFQKFQLENLVDFEKCCKTHIFLQKSEPIQPKTSNILPKFCQPTLSEAPRLWRRGARAGAEPPAARARPFFPPSFLQRQNKMHSRLGGTRGVRRRPCPKEIASLSLPRPAPGEVEVKAEFW